jgi:isopentenyl phosphate kinase
LEIENLVLIKMGGSVITQKDKPLTANLEGIDAISAAISKAGVPIVVVHGGGSYGHYFASKYGLSTVPSLVNIAGVSKTRLAMMELDLLVVQNLEKYSVPVYQIQAYDIFDDFRLSHSGRKRISRLVNENLVPILYGDVMPSNNGFFVLSGDRIIEALALALRPKRVVFTLDVDGVYPSPDKRGEILHELTRVSAKKLEISNKSVDVTGGLAAKIRIGFKLSDYGVDVWFVNGLKPERVLGALKGETTEGTVLRASTRMQIARAGQAI